MNESALSFCIIASGDLSHRLTLDAPAGYDKKGEEYDRFVKECIEENKLEEFLGCPESLRERAGECAHRPVSMLIGALGKHAVKNKIFSYEGPFGVGYMNAMMEIVEDEYVMLARKAIDTYIREQTVIDVPQGLSSKIYTDKSAVFVSIKKNGSLRGCIGTIVPVYENVALEVIENAIKAATEDPRFNPIDKSELEQLSISVDVLYEPEDINDMEMLDPYEYGVIVSKGYRRGLLLPNLEGVDTSKKQVEIALSKAGIYPDEKFKMQRFKVVRHK